MACPAHRGGLQHLGDEIVVPPLLAVQNCHPSPLQGPPQPPQVKMLGPSTSNNRPVSTLHQQQAPKAVATPVNHEKLLRKSWRSLRKPGNWPLCRRRRRPKQWRGSAWSLEQSSTRGQMEMEVESPQFWNSNKKKSIVPATTPSLGNKLIVQHKTGK